MITRQKNWWNEKRRTSKIGDLEFIVEVRERRNRLVFYFFCSVFFYLLKAVVRSWNIHVSHTQSSCRNFLKNPPLPFVIDGEQPQIRLKNSGAKIEGEIEIQPQQPHNIHELERTMTTSLLINAFRIQSSTCMHYI